MNIDIAIGQHMSEVSQSCMNIKKNIFYISQTTKKSEIISAGTCSSMYTLDQQYHTVSQTLVEVHTHWN